MGPEAKLLAKIRAKLKPLEQSGSVFVLKLHGGAAQKAGMPDLMVVKGGRVYFLELKSPTGQTTSLQLTIMARLSKCGAKVRVVRTVEEAMEFLKGENDD